MKTLLSDAPPKRDMGAIIAFPGRYQPRKVSTLPRRRRRPRLPRYDRSGLLMAALLLAAIAAAALSFRGEAEGAIAMRVIDGDTIENSATGERIRLSNIDTPETGERAGCIAERQAGERAKQALTLMIRDGAVSVAPSGYTDRYGRTLARVNINGRDAGQTLIDRGLARPWRGRREPWCGADGALLLDAS